MKLIALMQLTMSIVVGPLSFAQDPSSADFFESRIRPVLVKHCYECHAGTSQSIKGGLRVDWEGGLIQGGDSGAALVSGKPDDSLLLSALRFEELEMPPTGKLPIEIIEDFESWIKHGAFDPRKTSPQQPQYSNDNAPDAPLWSFKTIENVPDVPRTDSDWSETTIDQFLVAKHREQKLLPIEDTDPSNLMRRMAFDLTGLPPNAVDIERLLHAPRDFDFRAYADGLISSARFGEHWGRRWLDVARYADSNGGDFNATFHDAWRYRNYVVGAYNADMPFDQFIIEQIAGDLLPYKTSDERHRQLVATGFLMLGAKMLSERDKEKLRMDVVDEQIGAIGTAFLGLTLGCARCHDHKFDPIPTSDYYALAGIFKSTNALEGEIQKYVSNWKRVPLPIEPEHQQALAAHAEKLKVVKQAIAGVEKLVVAESKKGKPSELSSSDVIVDDRQAELVGNWKASGLSKPFVGVGYIHDENEEKGEKSVLFRTRLATGTYEVAFAFQGGATRALNVPVAVTHAGGIAQIEVNQQKQGTADEPYCVLGRFKFDDKQDALVSIATAGTSGFVVVDAIRFTPLDSPKSKSDNTKAADPKSGASDAAVDSSVLATAKKRLEELNEDLKALQKAAPIPAPTALAAQEAKQIGDCAICIRGEHNMPGNVVPRGFLTKLDYEHNEPIPADQSGRLQLARWIANERNPLTARVYVNRIWNHLMGVGIVASVDNFGRLGQLPSHPELLDRLATEFTQHGWSTKWLVREIVFSHAYRLSSRTDAANESIDPENLYLWRANRKRLSAESIRDTLLLASEQLETSISESPVSELGTLVTQNNANDSGYSQRSTSQRTLYMPIVRNELPSVMRVFDFADPDFGEGDRPETTVPEQALWMLNSKFARSNAEQIAERLLRQNSDVTQRIRFLYIGALGRPPTRVEQELATNFVNELPLNADSQRVATHWADLVQAVIASTSFRVID